MIITRRRILGAALLVPLEGLAQTCGVVTPSQTEGPFFTPNSPLRTSLAEAGSKAQRFVVSGRVLSPQCQPLANALVDVWHADEEGEYDNRGYRYRGHQFTDSEGRYHFEASCRPVSRARTPLPLKIQPKGRPDPDHAALFSRRPSNSRDGLYRRDLELKTTRSGEGPSTSSSRLRAVVERKSGLNGNRVNPIRLS
jgi:hypothetical protein